MYVYSYYNKLLERLSIKQSNKLSYLLVDEDPDFYIKYANLSKQNRQHGGKNDDVKKIIFNYDEKNFLIYEDKDNDLISFSLHNNNLIDTMEVCVALFIEPNKKFVYLQNISYYNKCTLGMPKTGGGSLLLNMTLAFIDSIKKKYSLKYIQLKDNSYFPCEQTETNIDLDSMYMFAHGSTWYGKYGFVPFDSKNESTDIEWSVNYNVNKTLVNIIPLGCTKIKEHFISAVDELELHHIFTEKIINEMFLLYATRPISKFFRDLLKRYNQTCGIFSLIYRQVMNDIGMKNLHGQTYYKLLEPKD